MKNLIVYDDVIADIMTNIRFQAINKELFITCKKLKISLIFITQSYFFVPKEARLNSTHYLIMKIYNKRQLQQIAINDSADIDYKNFTKINRNVHENHILHYQLIIIYVLEKIFQMLYENDISW